MNKKEILTAIDNCMTNIRLEQLTMDFLLNKLKGTKEEETVGSAFFHKDPALYKAAMEQKNNREIEFITHKKFNT